MSKIATVKEQPVKIVGDINKDYRIIVHDNKGSSALRKQEKINIYNYPYTLNISIGCLYRCPYCYIRFVGMFKKHAVFGKEFKIKLWMPEKLNKELIKTRNLDQQFKRVQINQMTEGYLPHLYRWFDTNNIYPINRKCLEIFKEEKEKNNSTWMLHIVTKSLEIRKDIDLIADMRDQVQVEITITTLDEEKKRIFEPLAPSVRKRLELIKELSDKTDKHLLFRVRRREANINRKAEK